MDGEQFRELQQEVRENNKILKGLQRRARIGTFLSTIKWLVIIAIAWASYYYVQPYLDQLQAVYEDVQEVTGTAKDLKIKAETTWLDIMEKFMPHDGSQSPQGVPEE